MTDQNFDAIAFLLQFILCGFCFAMFMGCIGMILGVSDHD